VRAIGELPSRASPRLLGWPECAHPAGTAGNQNLVRTVDLPAGLCVACQLDDPFVRDPFLGVGDR